VCDRPLACVPAWWGPQNTLQVFIPHSSQLGVALRNTHLGVNFLGVGTAPRDSSGLIMRLALLLASWSAAASGKQIVCETTVNVLHAFFEPPPRHARSLLSLIEPMCVVL
jgi:hypothetical protein